tara:strand:- start:2460 stop:3128 length:669 start_codon:yes stop_codon:yes gene_type:complete
MSVIEKLKEAVRSVVEAERQDLYAEARLQDGRVIATEAEQFSAGASVRVMSEDGEAAPLEAGTYDLADGGQVKVKAESKVEMMEDEEDKKDMAEHEEDKDEMSAVKAALVERFQISPEVAAEIVDVVKEAMKPEEVEAKEDKEEEMEEDKKKEEMSSHLTDLTHEMAIALEAINKRLAKLEEEPAAQPDRVLPKQEFNAVPKASNARGASVDNALNIINSFK